MKRLQRNLNLFAVSSCSKALHSNDNQKGKYVMSPQHIRNLFLKVKSSKSSRKQISIYILGICCLCIALFLTNHNYSLYKKPIAEVVKTNVVEQNKSADLNHNKDTVYSQKIIAKIMNGKYKGKLSI
jgi:uncharacterized membrane protein